MFHELLDNPTLAEPGVLQSQARQRFASLVSGSRFDRRSKADPIADGRLIILGTASYSRKDLSLLDEIDNAHSRWQQAWTIAVFDVTECKSPADMQAYLPQDSVPPQSPMLQVWESGILRQSAHGLQAVREALCKFGILPCP
jgi:hypothetical protein